MLQLMLGRVLICLSATGPPQLCMQQAPHYKRYLKCSIFLEKDRLWSSSIWLDIPCASTDRVPVVNHV